MDLVNELQLADGRIVRIRRDVCALSFDELLSNRDLALSALDEYTSGPESWTLNTWLRFLNKAIETAQLQN